VALRNGEPRVSQFSWDVPQIGLQLRGREAHDAAARTDRTVFSFFGTLAAFFAGTGHVRETVLDRAWACLPRHRGQAAAGSPTYGRQASGQPAAAGGT